ncbi:MAG: hypothetical protein ABI647_18495 [Gemmatimonadota bacterium]
MFLARPRRFGRKDSMPQVLIRSMHPLDTELTDYFRPYLAHWQSAALDIAAAQSAPDLSDRSPEHGVLATAFATLPKARRIRAGQKAVDLVAKARVTTRLEDQMLERKTNPEMANVMHPAPAANGSAARPSEAAGLSRERAAVLVKQLLLEYDLEESTGVPVPFASLDVSLVRVRCVDETDGWFGTESGSDEIAVGGFGIGGSQAQATLIAERSLGDYDDGTVRTYSPPERLALLPIDSGTDYPKRYFVTLLLVESDGGDFGGFLSDVIIEVRKYLESNWVWIIAGLASGIQAAVLALVLSWAVSKILALIAGLWDDDHFPEQQLEIDVQSNDGPTSSGETVVRFTGPGEYLLRVEWKLTNERPPHQDPHHEPRIPTHGQRP